MLVGSCEGLQRVAVVRSRILWHAWQRIWTGRIRPCQEWQKLFVPTCPIQAGAKCFLPPDRSPSDPRGPPTTFDWEAETFCPDRSATAEISRLLERTLLGRHVIRQHSTFSWLLMVVLSWCHVRSLLAILELKTGSHPPLPWPPSACCCACQSTERIDSF